MNRIISCLTLTGILIFGSCKDSPEIKPITFKKTYGSVSFDRGQSVQQTADGGYILLGYSGQSGSGFYLIKTDSLGNMEWSKVFDFGLNSRGYSVQQTLDRGFILVGSSGLLGEDSRVVKTDNAGDSIWTKIFGGNMLDEAHSVQQTIDGNYIVLGTTYNTPSGFYLLRLDSDGNLIWEKRFGGEGSGWSVHQTMDGGFVLTGYSYNQTSIEHDMFCIKTNDTGDTLWTKVFGGANDDYGFSVEETSDGNYLFLGATRSKGAGEGDFYVVTTDKNGTVIWEKTYGNSGNQFGLSAQQTSDGGFIFLGVTDDIGGNDDLYLVKIDKNGTQLWEKTFGGTGDDWGHSVQQTTDGGFILFGYTNSEGAGDDDFLLIKTDKDGNVQ